MLSDPVFDVAPRFVRRQPDGEAPRFVRREPAEEVAPRFVRREPAEGAPRFVRREPCLLAKCLVSLVKRLRASCVENLLVVRVSCLSRRTGVTISWCSIVHV